MFPNSDIANTFTCGANKMAYIAKFGLAIYIKDELVSKVNKSLFVLMSDESLNEYEKQAAGCLHPLLGWGAGSVKISGLPVHGSLQVLIFYINGLKKVLKRLEFNLKEPVGTLIENTAFNWAFKKAVFFLIFISTS